MAPKGRLGGIRASDLQAPSPNCLVVHPLDLPKIPKSKIQNPKNHQNPKSPKSKIQNPQNPAKKAWILAEDFGFWILGSLGILDFGAGFWILGILDFGFWGFWGFWILGFWGLWILDFRDFVDFGFWIFGTLCSRSLCAKFGFWNLGILDFGFWGSWILDFGLGILDGHLVTKFWMLHKKRRLCTPNRVGGFRLIALFPFQDPKTIAKRNTFKCNLLHKKPSLSNSQFWIPSRGSPNSKRTLFRWTVVYTISLHSSTEQNNEAPFFFAGDRTNLTPIESFFVRKSGTLRWHMEKTPAFFLVFLHFYPFLFIPVFCFLFLVIPLDCSVSFPVSKNYSQKEHF